MKTDSFSYEQLEQLTTGSATQQSLEKKKLSDWFAQISKVLGQVLFQQQEPKVWERVDSKGRHYWEVYNPTTAQNGYFGSELEVRIWLEGAGYRY